MTEHDFDHGMARLEGRFARKFTDGDRTEIWDLVYKWTAAQFTGVVEHFAENGRSLPRRPADWNMARRKCPTSEGMDYKRRRNITGNAKPGKESPGDPDRVERLGRMMGSSIPIHRAYARSLVRNMVPADRDVAERAYRGLSPDARARFESEDACDDSADRALDEELSANLAARRLANTQEEASESNFKPPITFKDYVDAYRKARGEKFKRVRLEPGENERIHAKILEDAFEEQGRGGNFRPGEQP